MNALQMNEMQEIPEVSEREGFRLETIDQVNWAFRKLSAIAAKRKEVSQLAEAEQYRIKSWLESESSKLDNESQFFESLLSSYALQQRDADPKWSKASTPYGTVKFRKQQPKWNYDEATLLESLKSTGRADLIRIKEEPNKSEIKKAVQVVDGMVIDPQSGAVLEGISIEEQSDSIHVEVEL